MPILQGKANDLAKMMKLDGFSCSTSRIQRFRTRHDIVFGKISGESNFVNSTVCDDWLHNIWPIIRVEYTDDKIFNADEAGIFYRLTPDRTLHFKSQSGAGGKLSKERITVLVAANMSGTVKKPLWVIGKSRNPRYSLYVTIIIRRHG